MRKRTTLTALTVSALLLAGCGGEAEPEPTPSTADASDPTATPTPIAEAATDAASPSTTGFAFTPPASEGDPEVVFMARWVPNDGADTSPIEGVVSVQIDGTPYLMDLEAEIPSTEGTGYYMEIYPVSPGTPVRMTASELSGAQGDLECTISILDDDSGPLVREMSTRDIAEEVPLAVCESQVP